MNWETTGYVPLIQKIIREGEKRSSRAGDVYSIFGEKLVIDISKEFPLLRGRKMFYKPVLGELAAMLRGPKNVEDFKKYGCNYWDAWGSTESGQDRGKLELDYGNAWIDFNGVNQLEQLVHTLKTNPIDRRMIITGWRPDRLQELSLPCCHLLYQWYVREGKYLDMVWYQRSVDTMIGLPSDIILAAAWTMLLANECGYLPGKVTMMLGDTHVYANHMASTVDYMRAVERHYPTKKEDSHEYLLDKIATVGNFHPDMFDIVWYEPSPAIKFELNV